MSNGGGFGGGFGQPGVRIQERTGSTESEIIHPLKQAGILALLVAVALVVILMEMALIGRGLLLVLALYGICALVWRVWWLCGNVWLRVGTALGAGVLVWLWLAFGQPYVERLWLPVWYGIPRDGYAPIQFGNDPLAMRNAPGWLVPLRLLLVPALALGYTYPAYLLSQRFGLSILFPQMDAFTPKPLEARPRIPRVIRTVDTGIEEPEEEHYRPIYVSAVDLEPHEQMIGEGVSKSNGTGNSQRHWNVGLLSVDQWDALKAHLDRGGRWSNRALSPRVMTDTQQRELTPLMVAAGLLKRTDSGHGKPAGYALSNAGRAFFAHRVYDQEDA
ncbi:MAG: hypothetical protein BWY63_00433 [Chloroflexi bacterium ADurb.Bin360]|nr:MAG: hypothetical protein BWY63_00433 [Chloroflexi bacterium ADurb.Bin360]